MKPSLMRNVILIALAVILLAGSHTFANFVIDYQWWDELGQTETWFSLLLYRILPAVAASLIAWVAMLWAHRGGVQFVGAPVARHLWYSRIVPLVLLVPAVVFIGSSVDSWTVMAYVGSHSIITPSNAWTDPVFGQDLSFFLFSLPFYDLLLRFVFVTAVFAILVFWATGMGWQTFERLSRFREAGGAMKEFDPGPNPLLLTGATCTNFARILASLSLIAAAAWFFLGRYQLLMNEHPFMTGVDYVDETITLPLQWVVFAALLASVPLVWAQRVKLALGVVAVSLIANALVPTLVSSVYVRPNELALERPYIERHIAATSEAFGIVRRAQELEFGSSRVDQGVGGPFVLPRNLDTSRPAFCLIRAIHDDSAVPVTRNSPCFACTRAGRRRVLFHFGPSQDHLCIEGWQGSHQDNLPWSSTELSAVESGSRVRYCRVPKQICVRRGAEAAVLESIRNVA